MNHKNYIRMMFDATKDGVLTLTHYPEDGSEEFHCAYSLDWDEKKAEALEKQIEKLYDQLTQIGKLHLPLLDSAEEGSSSASVLKEELLDAWNTYIAPFEKPGVDEEELADAEMKKFYGVKLTESEEALLKKYDAWYGQQCLQRLPYLGCSPVGLISRARRYERLVSLRAPAVVLENEARCLAEEMVLYYCMKK